MDKRTSIISDRDKGLKSSLKDELPQAWHRNCAFHIKKNLTKHVGGSGKFGRVSDLFWSIQGSRTRQQYQERMNKLHTLKKSAFDYLSKIDPDCWVLYPALEKGMHTTHVT